MEKSEGGAHGMAICSIAYLSTHITERLSITSEGAWACQGFERLVSLMMGRIGGLRESRGHGAQESLGHIPFLRPAMLDFTGAHFIYSLIC